VFGIIGNVGPQPPRLPCIRPQAAHDVLWRLHRREPAAARSAGSLRVQFQGELREETDAVVRYLVNVRRLRPEQIVVFAQQDAFGDAGFDGVAKAVRTLRSGRDSEVLRLNYKRNTIDVDEAVAQLRSCALRHGRW